MSELAPKQYAVGLGTACFRLRNHNLLRTVGRQELEFAAEVHWGEGMSPNDAFSDLCEWNNMSLITAIVDRGHPVLEGVDSGFMRETLAARGLREALDYHKMIKDHRKSFRYDPLHEATMLEELRGLKQFVRNLRQTR